MSTAPVMPVMLQWGHDFSVMERITLDSDDITLDLLQWGHDFSVMESPGSWTSPGRCAQRFNGAMTFQSWKEKEAGKLLYSPFGCFNGAMTFQSWKGVRVLGQNYESAALASMGP